MFTWFRHVFPSILLASGRRVASQAASASRRRRSSSASTWRCPGRRRCLGWTKCCSWDSQCITLQCWRLPQSDTYNGYIYIIYIYMCIFMIYHIIYIYTHMYMLHMCVYLCIHICYTNALTCNFHIAMILVMGRCPAGGTPTRRRGGGTNSSEDGTTAEWGDVSSLRAPALVAKWWDGFPWFRKPMLIHVVSFYGFLHLFLL